MWIYTNEECTEALNVDTGAYVDFDYTLAGNKNCAVCIIAGEEYHIIGKDNIKRLRQKIGTRVADLES